MAVAAGMAGLLYGFDAIPKHWLEQLARKEDIADLVKRLSE
jgi:ADP-ribosylglycohydrolase